MARADDQGRLPAGAALASFLDLHDLLRRAVTYAADAAGADGTRLLLHDPDAQEFVLAEVAGEPGGQRRGHRSAETEATAGAVLKSGQPQLVAGADGRSRMGAPLTVGGATVGVIEAARRGTPFTSADLERFAGCCGLIAVALENASLYRHVGRDSEILRRAQDSQVRPLVAVSAAMRQALAQAERAAAGRSTILLTGETGTGKEQVARRIHERSSRAAGPFVAINCAALPEGLLESELFGHEKGAFTDADRRRIGWFELAEGGTLFLDEIGDLPASAQGKLLRVLQEREVVRVGGAHPIRVDVRLIAATHRDLSVEVRDHRFREDLFFRLQVVPIHLPPLRERPEDVEALTQLFAQRFAAELGRRPRPLTVAALDLLRAHRWPGNVRELENLVERLLVLGNDDPIEPRELAGLLPEVGSAAADGAAPAPAAPVIADLSLWEHEHALLVRALERSGGNQSRAARLLKISREQLRTRMRRYGLLRAGL